MSRIKARPNLGSDVLKVPQDHELGIGESPTGEPSNRLTYTTSRMAYTISRSGRKIIPPVLDASHENLLS